MKLDRLLAITIILINRKKITARELAERFEVSVRTIHRDIEAINMAGIPVSSHQGSNGGFGIMENYKLDRNVLTNDEVLSIMTALKGISTALDDKAIDSTLEKLKALVPEYELEDIKKRQESTFIDFTPWGCSPRQKEYVGILRKAIEDCRIVTFTYTNSRGESNERAAEPLYVYFKGYNWYLAAYCRLKNDFRFFKLTRVKKLTLTNEKFIRRDIPERYLGLYENNPDEVSLVLRFKPSARARVEDSYGEEQITPLEDGRFIVRVTFPEDEWVYGHILGYGSDVEVLEPPRLRELIKKRAREIYEQY